MKNKLLLLNALLLGVFVLGASELYRQWLEAEARYARLEEAERVVPLPDFPTPAERARIRPASYMPAVERMLFTKDRNPVVEVVVEETPEVVRPELPLLAGLADFGDGPRALMAAAANDTPQWLEAGEKVGDFIFEGLEGQKVKLSWQGEELTVAQDQLVGAMAPRETRTSKTSRPRLPAGGGAPAQAQQPANLAENAPKPVGGEYNIGKELRPGVYAVDSSDKSPHGTSFKHSDGSTYTKTVRRTPFGSQSWWEKK